MTHDLEKEHARFQVDDMVRHHGTKQWGKVVQVTPTNYGVELIVERVVDEHHDVSGLGHWEGARIDRHKRNGVRVLDL